MLLKVFTALALAASAGALGQVSPASLEFEMVQGRPAPHKLKLVIAGAGGSAWKASVKWPAKNPALALSAGSGTAPATLTVSLVDWAVRGLAPGDYSGSVVITSSSVVEIPVNLKIVAPAPAPRFSYIQGPNGCRQVPGYDDAALCDIPDRRPPGQFIPPPAGESYPDPVFGARVTMLAGPVARHPYSNPSAVSAGNKHVLAVKVDPETKAEELTAISPKTGEVLYSNLEANLNTATVWDARDADVYYFLSGAAVKKRNLRRRKTTTVIDFSRAPYKFARITAGGTGDTSKDNWLAFWAPNEKQVCALDLDRAQPYCSPYEPALKLPIARIDYILIAKGVDRPTGKRYVMLMGRPADAVFSVNEAAKRLDFEYQGPEDLERNGNQDGVCDPGERCLRDDHADTFEDSAGVQYLVTGWEMIRACELTVASLQLNKAGDILKPVELGGGFRKLMTVYRCGTVWQDMHFGCAKASPFCVVSSSMFGGRLRAADDPTPFTPTPHFDEIFVIRDNGAEVRRLVHSRTVLFSSEPANAYWSTPRASISNDGSLVVATSNFGEPGKQRVIAIETGMR